MDTGVAPHRHQTSSWVAVSLMIVSSVLLGIALIAWSLALGVVGLVVGLVGAVVAVAFRLMDDAH